MAADLKGLIETVAKALADHPEAVNVRESERRGGTVYELQVAATDLGRVIGHGTTKGVFIGPREKRTQDYLAGRTV